VFLPFFSPPRRRSSPFFAVIPRAFRRHSERFSPSFHALFAVIPRAARNPPTITTGRGGAVRRASLQGATERRKFRAVLGMTRKSGGVRQRFKIQNSVNFQLLLSLHPL
jgi:hypothetical protein